MDRKRNRREEPARPERPRAAVDAKPRSVAHQRTVHLVLAAIVVIAVVVEVFFRDVELVDRFAPNIATESMGILLVLIFVQRYLERQERAHRLRGSIGGLRKASRALQRLEETWAQLVKGTLPRVPEPLLKDVPELFEPHFTEELAHIEPASMRFAAGDGEPWVRWARRETVAACELLNQIIIAYSGSLDPAYVEAIDELVDDPFIALFDDLAESTPDPRRWRVQMNAGRALREAHFARLNAAIALHNSLARDAAGVRTRRMAPRTGTIGMELPMDHDLRVETELTKRWWGAAPSIGKLRAGQVGV